MKDAAELKKNYFWMKNHIIFVSGLNTIEVDTDVAFSLEIPQNNLHMQWQNWNWFSHYLLLLFFRFIQIK